MSKVNRGAVGSGSGAEPAPTAPNAPKIVELSQPKAEPIARTIYRTIERQAIASVIVMGPDLTLKPVGPIDGHYYYAVPTDVLDRLDRSVHVTHKRIGRTELTEIPA